MKNHSIRAEGVGEIGAYAALRLGGAQAATARLQLGLSPRAGARLEAAFRRKSARGGGDAQLPRFARHEAHVAQVLREGGFPALTEARLGRDRVCVRLPLTFPAAASLKGRSA